MCDYEHEYSFCFDDTFHEDDTSSSPWDCDFEMMWDQIGEELRQEQENNMLIQSFEGKLTLQSSFSMDTL